MDAINAQKINKSNVVKGQTTFVDKPKESHLNLIKTDKIENQRDLLKAIQSYKGLQFKIKTNNKGLEKTIEDIQRPILEQNEEFIEKSEELLSRINQYINDNPNEFVQEGSLKKGLTIGNFEVIITEKVLVKIQQKGGTSEDGNQG